MSTRDADGIATVAPAEAAGRLARIYDAAVRRAGKVFGILRIQSLNPPALEASMDLYLAVMHGPSPLTRAQRERVAVVVSALNECHY